jgi:hypothetical protein
MKTKLMMMIAVMMFTFSSLFATNDVSSLMKTINSKISFPAMAIERHIEGTVFVEFTVTAKGEIEVLNCNSLEWELQTYVFQTLSGISIKPNPELTGKVFTMRFDFNLY